MNKPTDTDNAGLSNSNGTNVNTTNNQPTLTLRRGRSKGNINVTSEAPTNSNSENNNAGAANSIATNEDTTYTQPTVTLRRGKGKGKINVTSETPTNFNSEINNAGEANSIGTNEDTTTTLRRGRSKGKINVMSEAPTNINSKINNAADSIGINENTTNATITLRRGRSKGKINITRKAPTNINREINKAADSIGINEDTKSTQPTITLRRGGSKGKINITNEATTNSSSEVLSTEITANISTGHRAKRKFRDIPSDSDNDNEKKAKKFGSKKARGITNIITEHLSTERNAAGNEESSDVKRKEKVFDISENTALRKRKADENENDLAIDEGKKKAAKSENGSSATDVSNKRSSGLSILPPTKGVFGSGTKYARNPLVESFTSTLSSSIISIFDEQPSRNNGEGNGNSKNDESNVEEVVPFGKRTQTFLQELEGNNNNNNDNDDGDNDNNNNTFFMLIYLVITGEENEITQHSVQAKLYYMVEKTWKERGFGILKLNYSRNEEKSPRLVMRADSVLKVILNVALSHGMHVERSQEKFIRLFAFEGKGDSLVHLAIKLSNCNEADDLYEAIKKAILPAHDRA
ncbi:hypothetical protein Glove_19g404 [Diversispora epigaea]|uniref:RanBD1 domain-containing protein n=1 Tax=Diversispora epigaea TaxID=1348612 RepID=A0A397JNZ4_9GLOM|nr:hypothetical protein Glove_19g404 [Diversispora epigaea]